MVEGAIESHLKRPSHLYQFSRTLYIDGTITAQYSQNNAARTQEPQLLQVLAHHIELRVRINEVAAARTQQHMHGQPATVYGFTNQAMAWSQSTFTQSAAKFNTICPAIPRNEACIDTLGT